MLLNKKKTLKTNWIIIFKLSWESMILNFQDKFYGLDWKTVLHKVCSDKQENETAFDKTINLLAKLTYSFSDVMKILALGETSSTETTFNLT